jgi:hypothetical protein
MMVAKATLGCPVTKGLTKRTLCGIVSNWIQFFPCVLRVNGIP